jgi:hypothetical protein
MPKKTTPSSEGNEKQTDDLDAALEESEERRDQDQVVEEAEVNEDEAPSGA